MYLNIFKTPIMVPTPRAWRVHLAAMFMHEVGHSLGITPWTVEGCDNLSSFEVFFTPAWREYKQTWGNYYSVMNYFWVVSNDWLKVLIDYSDGSNADTGYDVNDWETFYLPSFQTVSDVNEDITATPPCYDLLEIELDAVERLEFGKTNMKYDSNFTEEYLAMIDGRSPINPVDMTFRVYRKTDQVGIEINQILVYGLPNVYPTDSEFLLIKQGFIDSTGEMKFYSQQELIDEKMAMISKK